MSSCVITIGGSTGQVLIKYTLGSNSTSFTAAPGDPIYISSTATDVTYTTLSGDASASSGCVTINELAINYYEIFWETGRLFSSSNPNLQFVAVDLATDETEIDSVSYHTSSAKDLADSINAADIDGVHATSYASELTERNTSLNKIILRIYGTDVPYVRARNEDSVSDIYIKGTTVSDAVPDDFTEIIECPSDL